ncbi:hypothetical protein T552_00421 [Pneumocystis carinii B80]|uniref:Uncharacterized protein n=1 Tax=Pneumocystis carinii (strain B80) TaxID=1408658 RepID=A0A0W4ZQQ8_PNEC8|nr:hypothetical protein T552_00421 [Pneumocystis carinii B80]KTW30709.1 hypothetical protein T552_00421 [Pneumocystis carinii B80]
MRFMRSTLFIWVRRGQRCISTEAFQIQVIGALTRKAEETNVSKIQEMSSNRRKNMKKDLFERLKRKKINILANPLIQGILPYDESKIPYGMKNSTLKKGYMGLPRPNNASIMDTNLIPYEEYEDLLALLRDINRGVSRKEEGNNLIGNEMLKEKFKSKKDDYEKNKKINHSSIIKKESYGQDMNVAKFMFVSKKDLGPYMPDWVILSKKLNNIEPKGYVARQFKGINKGLKRINVKVNEKESDCKDIFNMNEVTFFNDCIYKNSSIKPYKKIEMINIINDMLKCKTI